MHGMHSFHYRSVNLASGGNCHVEQYYEWAIFFNRQASPVAVKWGVIRVIRPYLIESFAAAYLDLLEMETDSYTLYFG